MANDKDWQRRSDEWVKAMHKSRLQKDRRTSAAEEINTKEGSREKMRFVKTTL